MGDAVAIGVDVGGTKLLGLAVASDGSVLDRTRRSSPRADPVALLTAVAEVAEHLGGSVPVGVGMAGAVSRDGTLRYGPNLDVADVPVRSWLEERLGVPVVVGNDANVALYGELRAGACRGVEDAVMLTLGTGVGGAVVVRGELVEGANGLAGELGHVIVADGGRPCPCGNAGCLEAYASGTAIGSRAQELLREGATSSLQRIDVVDGKSVTLAALDGDELARRVLDEAGYWLGVGLTGVVNLLDPEIVVVGGGAATTAAPLLLPRAVAVLGERVLGGAHRQLPPVVAAQLGDDAGAIGAALLAQVRHDPEPG